MAETMISELVFHWCCYGLLNGISEDAVDCKKFFSLFAGINLLMAKFAAS